jgi:phosphatidylglycerol---prolipoprotein diacylglyceryl transferase
MRPFLFTFGEIHVGGTAVPLGLPGYGVAVLLGMLLGGIVWARLGARAYPEVPWRNLYLGTLASALAGAKLLEVALFLPDIAAGRMSLVAALVGGGIWLGGVVGGFAYFCLFLRRRGFPVGLILNAVCPAIPLGHAVGRVGCLLAGCCYGGRCTMPWAITYSDEWAARLSGTPLGVPLHPSPVYETGLELLNFAICYRLAQRALPAWCVPAAWAMLYGGERFLLEFLRGDPRPFWAGLSAGQWMSVALVILGAFALMRRETLRPTLV